MQALRVTWVALLAVGCDAASAKGTASESTSAAETATAASPTNAVEATGSSETDGSSAAASAAPSAAASATPSTAANAAPAAAASAATAPGDDEPCPSEMAHIGRFCIDRWEAHLARIGPNGRVPHPHHARPAPGVRYVAVSAPNVRPQGYVSRHEAQAACEEAGKRLCRWIEWRRACQGPRWLRYPYGNGGRKGACNTGKDHLLAELHGEDSREWDAEAFNDPALAKEPDYLAATGAFEDCVSAEGVHDMVGNLHEWVSTPVTKRMMAKLESEAVERVDQPWSVGNGMFLGGFFSTTDEHGPGCHYATVAHAPRYHDYSTGFRCCADADPSGR